MLARQKSARVWVEMHLTRREIRELQDRAYADRRAIGFLEQRLGVLQVGGVEAFGEPVVDGLE